MTDWTVVEASGGSVLGCVEPSFRTARSSGHTCTPHWPGEKTDLSSQRLGIRRDGGQSPSRDVEENAVNHFLVLTGDRGDLLWHREHDVKMRYLQEFGLAVLDPLRSSQRLALWAVPIPATVEAIPLMATLIASLEVATEGRRSTQFDCGHDAPLRRGHRRAMLFSVSCAVAAEEVRHFQLRAIHGPRSEVLRRGGLGVCRDGSR